MVPDHWPARRLEKQQLDGFICSETLAYLQ